jgi:hypothetical protein
MAGGGSRPGERRGGRKKGALNKATRERMEMARRELDAAATGKARRPLAKERLEELFDISLGAMRLHQEVTPEMAARAHAAGNTDVVVRAGDWDRFGEWWDRAFYVGEKLMRTQTPYLRALMVGVQGVGEAAGAPAESAKVVEATVDTDVEIDDAATRSQQTYLRLVKG